MSAVTQSYRELVASGSITGDPAQLEVVAALDELATAVQQWEARRGHLSRWFGGQSSSPMGLYIHGGVGRGKTMLMDLFFEAAATRRKRRWHFHSFMSDTHAAIARARHAIEGDPLPEVARAIAAEVHLLCFDELHVTDIADAMILSRLFKGLFERGVVMVATSNSHPRDLYKDGLNRALFLPCVDLIEQHMRIVELQSPTDYRLAKLTGERMYFSPLGPESDAAMDRVWRRLTASVPCRPLVLEVSGRRLEIANACLGTARCTFDELCERPLGSLDYLALTDSVQMLLLDRIPRLPPERRNAARRFVTLVDTLYDRRIGLVASADGLPTELYPAGDGAELFERTASRLIEMQGSEYLRDRAAPGRAR